jgi:hypothetical protein
MGKNFQALMKGLHFGGRNLLGTFVLLPDALKAVFKNPNFSRTRKGRIFIGIFLTVAVKLTPPGAAAFFIVDTVKGARREHNNLVLNELGTALNLRARGFSDDGAGTVAKWLCAGDADSLMRGLNGRGLSSRDAGLLFDMLAENEGEQVTSLDEIVDTPRSREVPTHLNKSLNPFHRRRIGHEEMVSY